MMSLLQSNMLLHWPRVLPAKKKKPVVAIYSTFLQRAYDQLIHDVAIQNLDVTFGIDRAGLVGEDGPTHAGSFDISYLRCIPNIIIMTPSDENETRQLLLPDISSMVPLPFDILGGLVLANQLIKIWKHYRLVVAS